VCTDGRPSGSHASVRIHRMMPPTMSSPKTFGCALLLALAALTGCDRGSAREITVTRVASRPSHEIKLDATTADRFDMGSGPAEGGPHAHGPARKPLAWATPPSWSERADPGNMRLGSFAVAGNPDADCSIVLLPGSAGGV